MAVTFTLTSTGLTTIDLTDTSTSIFLQESEYVPVVATPPGDGTIPPYVTETLPVGLHATTYNAYCLLLQNLAALQKRAAEYWVNPQQSVPVWLTCKLDGETTGREALVKAIHFEFRPWTEALYRECAGATPPGHLFGTILVERHPYWEKPIGLSFPNLAGDTGVCVSYDYTTGADVVGDVPARIEGFCLKTNTAAIALERFWMGIRSATLHGATGVTAFKHRWECEDGSFPDAEVTEDAASEVNLASPGAGVGSFLVVTPAGGGTDWDDGSFHNVVTIAADAVGYATASDAFGRFLWLLRAKVSAGTWEVRFSIGYSGTGSVRFNDPVEVTNTSWDIHEMGIGKFPPRDMQTIPVAVLPLVGDLKMQVSIDAKRTAGAGTLSLDCLYDVPTDEGFIKIPNGYATTTVVTLIAEGPNDTAQVITLLSGTHFTLPTFEIENFRLPPGDGRVIIVYARAASSVFTDEIEYNEAALCTLTYAERWTALRGTE